MATPRNARPGMLLDPGAPINSGLVGWWPMWEGAGGKTLDISGKNNHGTLTNGPVWSGGKLKFDGTDDFVSIDGLVSSVSAATSGSVFVEFSNNAATVAPLFYIGQSGTNNNLFRLSFSAANTLQVLLKTASDFYRGTADLGAGSSDGSKHSLLFSVSAAGNRLYYDGRLQTLTYTTGSSATSNWLSSLASLDAASIASDRIAIPNYLSGNIYACRIWNRALSDLEAQQLYVKPNIGIWVPDITRYYIPAAGGSVAASAGTSVVSGAGASTAASSGTVSGASTATATGASTAASVASAGGTSTVAASGASTVKAVGTAAGTSTVSGVGTSTGGGSVASASGTGTVTGVGAATASSVASASATTTVGAIGASTASGVGQSSGTSIVSGIGASTARTTAAAAGSGTAAATGASAASATANAAGSSTAAAISNAVAIESYVAQFRIPADARSFRIPADARSFRIPADARSFKILRAA